MTAQMLCGSVLVGLAALRAYLYRGSLQPGVTQRAFAVLRPEREEVDHILFPGIGVTPDSAELEQAIVDLKAEEPRAV